MSARPAPGAGALDAAAIGLVALLCLTWGLHQVSAKIALPGISPVMQGGLRSVGSLALLVAWSLWRGIPLLRRDRSLAAGLTAGMLFAAEFFFLYLAIGMTSASRTVVFVYTAPFFVALGAHVFLPGERLRASHVLGLTAALGGVVLAFADGSGAASNSSLLGDALAVVGAVVWAATTILIKGSRMSRLSAEKTLFYQLGVSALMLPIASLVIGEAGFVQNRLSFAVVMAMLFQIVVVSFASYLTWFWLMTRYAASKLSAFTFLTPLFGVAAGALILGEPISPIFALAMALVCLGLWLVNRPRRDGGAV